jgi:hypothetical protein
MRDNVRAELDRQLKQRQEALTSRFDEQRASRLRSEPLIRKIFQEPPELGLTAPQKLALPTPPIQIPRPEKSWLKHGSVFIMEVPPFDVAYARGSVTGGGFSNPQADTEGQLVVEVDCQGPGPSGTAASFAAVAMNYSPPGPSCTQAVTSGMMTASTSVSFTWIWEAGSKLWAAGVVDFVIGLQVQAYDIDGNLIGVIGNQMVQIVSENYEDFLSQSRRSDSGTLSLSTQCHVSNLYNYSILVTAFADASAWGGSTGPDFFESFALGLLEVDVPFISISINYP